MRTRGDIQEGTDVVGAQGGVTQTWSTFSAGVAAEFLDPRGREFIAAQQRIAEVTDLIEIRFIEGVTQKMRWVEGSRTFDILYVGDPDRRRRRLHLAVRELVGA